MDPFLMSVTFAPPAGAAGPSSPPATPDTDPVAANPADDSIAVLLSDVTRLFWRRLEAGLREAGLDFTAGEARTLVNVARQGGLRQSVLAERMRIEPMTLVGFLDRLESRGLVVRLPDPADRRAKLIAPTDAAAEPVAHIHAVAAAVKAEVTAGFAVSEVDVLREMLQRIRSNLDALALDRGSAAS